MRDIQGHQTLEMRNVLSYRAKMTQQELQAKSQEIEKVLLETGAKRSASIATTTFSVEAGAVGQVMDVEILVPLDREITPPAGYVWKSHFLLTNALRIRHVGNPAKLQDAINELNAYIVQHQLVPISSGYNVTVKDAKTPLEVDSMEIDVYVGISPNLL